LSIVAGLRALTGWVARDPITRPAIARS
jgi:hypothetical protein